MRKVIALSGIVVFILLMGCKDRSSMSGRYGGARIDFDLDSILKRGTIRIITDYNSVNYFVYKGVPVGYQFEMLKALCDHLGIVQEIKVSNDKEKNIGMLLRGEADIIATNLAVSSADSGYIAYTLPHCSSRQVLVQRKWDNGSERNRNKNKLVSSETGLAGKTVYVLQNSSYVDRLKQISDKLTDSITIVQVPDYDVEQLMHMVAEGELPYTVCFENIANVNKGLYPNLDIKTVLSDDIDLAWGVRPDAVMLLNTVNRWMEEFKKSGQYQQIYRRYFVNYRPIVSSVPGSSFEMGEHNPTYDDIIKANVANTRFDWRLIASLIYQESRFDPEAESWAGAVGLMQLMPETARLFGVESSISPQDNIEGGIRFLNWLDERLERYVKDKNERLKFVLASYNVGIGHVIDAINLAEKFGKNPAVWDNNVDMFLLNKSNPSYYGDPVVKYGYCRGEEPYLYVKSVMTRYKYYKTIMK
jgi:membrane-bound lytic murein transglycosylase F